MAAVFSSSAPCAELLTSASQFSQDPFSENLLQNLRSLRIDFAESLKAARADAVRLIESGIVSYEEASAAPSSAAKAGISTAAPSSVAGSALAAATVVTAGVLGTTAVKLAPASHKAGSAIAAIEQLGAEGIRQRASELVAALADLGSKSKEKRRDVVILDVLVMLDVDGTQQKNVQVQCSINITVNDAKLLVIERLGKTPNDVNEFRMQTVGSSMASEEPLRLAELRAVRAALSRSHQRDKTTLPHVRFVCMHRELIKRDKQLARVIGSLVGSPLRPGDDLDEETMAFRDSFKRLRKQMFDDGKLRHLPIEPNLAEGPLPADFPEEMVFRLYFNAELIKTVKLSPHLNTTDALRATFEKLSSSLTGFTLQPYTEYVFKVPGEREYIFGPQPLSAFKFVRSRARKGQFTDLTVVLKASIADLTAPVEDEYPEIFFETPEDVSTVLLHQPIAVDSAPLPHGNSFISLWDLTSNVHIHLAGVDGLVLSLVSWDWHKDERKSKVEGAASTIFVEAALYHGQELLAPPVYSTQLDAVTDPRFSQKLSFNLAWAKLPRATRLCLTVWGQKKASDDYSPDSDNNYALGWCSLNVIDFRNRLLSGQRSQRMWLFDPANPIGTVAEPPREAPVMNIAFPEHVRPVVFPKFDAPEDVDLDGIKPPPPEIMISIRDAVNKDPLAELTRAQKQHIWDHRYFLLDEPRALPKFLSSVRWSEPDQVAEAHRLLDVWKPLSPMDSLELLDANYFDARVRAFAVECLAGMSDEMLGDFLLQLIQVIKFESYHDSHLVRFLCMRALQSREIGHSFFWYLKAEVEVPEVSERFSLLLEAYLRGAGAHREQLLKQNELLDQMVHAANAIKEVKGPERMAVLRRHLEAVSIPGGRVQILLNPRWETRGLRLDKCKYMDSKKLPLWLVFENADESGSDLYVIFKSGDDLRQDKLTLQLFAIMDKMWSEAGLPLRLDPYDCVATGPELGMIQVVRNANTVANIQKDHGGASAAFRDDPLAIWLRDKNKSDTQYAAAVQTFTLSCAAYCVATYVLGIGDRHNDNIMIQEHGRLFHIDFGHFLGNIKRKLGIRRERSPFVLTPDMVYIMGGRTSATFEAFVDLCCRGYLVLRSRANLFINLMAMMVSTGIPELRSTKDLQYLRVALCLDMNEDQARQAFAALVHESLDKGWATQLNFASHIIAHRK